MKNVQKARHNLSLSLKKGVESWKKTDASSADGASSRKRTAYFRE